VDTFELGQFVTTIIGKVKGQIIAVVHPIEGGVIYHIKYEGLGGVFSIGVFSGSELRHALEPE